MPPRYAYWTILVDDQPTAFRSGSQEELMPTFKRLQQKHPSAKMMWWQNGKLWNSRLDAQEAMRARGDIGRSRDVRQRPAERYSNRAPSAGERREERGPSGKLDWKPKSSSPQAPKPSRSEKPEWKPKRESSPGSRLPAPGSRTKAAWTPKSQAPRPRSPEKLEWKPKGEGPPRSSSFPKSQAPSPRSPEKLEWKPKGESATGSRIPDPGSREKRKWIPKAEYKKSQGLEAKKDKNWRPGGEHKDPRQKYKDAKKAKWGRFKQTVRKRWESKAKKNDK